MTMQTNQYFSEPITLMDRKLSGDNLEQANILSAPPLKRCSMREYGMV
jgi:hypothetical protein